MTYFIHIVGPYDSCFVGPWDSLDAANAYIRSIDRAVFSAYLLTAGQFQDNINEFGWAEVVQPEGRLQ